MDDNNTVTGDILQIQGFDISPRFTYPLALLLLLIYLLILISNIGVLLLIVSEKSLHQPMYILFCNLSVNDLMGNTVLLPRLMVDIVSTERRIAYSQCVAQAFYSHTFGSASHLILIVMAFDRYVAICHPLRYGSVMTPRAVLPASSATPHHHKQNPAFLHSTKHSHPHLTSHTHNSPSLPVRLLPPPQDTYPTHTEPTQQPQDEYIQAVCDTRTGARSRGVLLMLLNGPSTCLITDTRLQCEKPMLRNSHLALYLIMLWSGFLTIILHRFPDHPDLRKIAYILFHVIPANLNPIIYAMQSRALREKILQVLCRKVTPNS
ncbi:hypothetical protein CRUP_010435 [Coryphaenoides rupestris]|nr:hypothetical protein CRUP_010435 [Coryphaenoides rupestris]